MNVKTYDQNGIEVGQTRLPSEIFDVKLNTDLLHQVAVSEAANRRRVIAHTKNRGEVRGGGKKPWRQKGTGRARHGSIRSPLWRGGGVTFGPTKERVFKQKINKKMRRKALFMALSAKAKNNFLIVLDKIALEQPKTKLMAHILEKLPIAGSVLLALPSNDKKIIRAGRNLPEVEIIEARNLNALELLSSKYLIMPKDAIKTVKETFLR